MVLQPLHLLVPGWSHPGLAQVSIAVAFISVRRLRLWGEVHVSKTIVMMMVLVEWDKSTKKHKAREAVVPSFSPPPFSLLVCPSYIITTHQREIL